MDRVNSYLTAFCMMGLLMCMPLKLLAGSASTTFPVSVKVINPCKIGTKNGQKYLYDCVKPTGKKDKKI